VKALVTGAAGFIGSHLTAALLDRGAAVVGVDSFTDYYPRALKEKNLEENRLREGFRFAETSIQSADLQALLDGVTHVFHLAAQAGVRKSWGRDFRTYTVNNVEATQLLLEACVGRSIERFVHASSSSVYGDRAPIPMREDALPQPVSPYGVTKMAAEQLGYLYHVNYGLPVVAMRYFTVYGPRQRPDMAFHRFIAASLHDEPIALYGDGEQTRDFTFVSDAIAATVAAGERGVNGTVLQHRRRLARVDERRRQDHREDRRPSAQDSTAEDAQKGDMRDTYADTTLAKRDLGFAPKVTLEEGIQAEYRWLASPPRSYDIDVSSSGGAAARARPATSRACASRRPEEAADRHARARQVSVRSRQREHRKKRWIVAREYFRQLVDSYPQSQYRADAKLGIGDAFMGEKIAASYVLAINEYREFLSFLPTHTRADYAQYQAGDGLLQADAIADARPDRKRATRSARFQAFITRFPEPGVVEAVSRRQAAAARGEGPPGRLGCRRRRAVLPLKWYPGVIGGWSRSSRTIPSTRGATTSTTCWRDVRCGPIAGRGAPYFERLVNEFEQSETARTGQEAHSSKSRPGRRPRLARNRRRRNGP
jgi:UDP-glucose 4-epimerase